jgi:SAM-dependent methyltransferase
MSWPLPHSAAIGAWCLLITSSVGAQHSSGRKPDVHFVVTRQPVVEGMLRLAAVHKEDVVYDLGSGDGRIVITAAKRYGARGVGIELDTGLIRTATRKARDVGVADRVRFLRQDLFATDISSATVVTLYLGPALNLKLRPMLYRALRPGTRIVSHGWDMGDWQADARHEVDGRSLFFWTIPANVSGAWRWQARDGRAEVALLEQRYQRASGAWIRGADSVPIASVRLVGDSIAIRAARGGEVFRFTGRVRGDAIHGTIMRSGKPPAVWAARRTSRGSAIADQAAEASR